MLTNFTVTVETMIAGEKYVFSRTFPLNHDIARRCAGAEVTMVLDELFQTYKCANLIMHDSDDTD